MTIRLSFPLLCLSAALCLWPLSADAGSFKTYNQTDYERPYNAAWMEENRTVNRTPSGTIYYPEYFVQRPEHYEFLPQVSNWDVQNMHPQQWQGQDWEPAQWNPAQWTPEVAVKKFYAGGIFRRQYMRGKTPVLELGPRFYNLSDLDQRRTLKLLTDYTGIFGRGHTLVELRDWNNKSVVGRYTPQGMYLN
jgi:hypothetical protein